MKDTNIPMINSILIFLNLVKLNFIFYNNSINYYKTTYLFTLQNIYTLQHIYKKNE